MSWTQSLGQRPPKGGENAGWRKKGKKYNERNMSRNTQKASSKADAARSTVQARPHGPSFRDCYTPHFQVAAP